MGATKKMCTFILKNENGAKSDFRVVWITSKITFRTILNFYNKGAHFFRSTQSVRVRDNQT